MIQPDYDVIIIGSGAGGLACAVALAQAGKVPDKAGHRFKVIVSGGVAGIEDVKQVKANEDNGLEGLIIGKALYAGTIDLAEAMRIAHE